MRALVRSVALLGVIGLVTLVSAAPSLAHATYKSSNPDDESTVSSPPSQITAEFSEPMSDGSYMDVTDPCGRDVGSGSSQTGSSMTVQNSGTAAGTYVVFWRAVSLDTHPTEGEFTFRSSGGDPCPGEKQEVDPGDGGGNGAGGSGNGGGSSSGGGDSTGGGIAGSSGGHAGHSKGSGSGRGDGSERDGGGRGSDASQGQEDSTTALADDPRSDVPDAPSALEGIPIDGLLITLAVAALIGAAAGKVYVSLSGDE